MLFLAAVSLKNHTPIMPTLCKSYIYTVLILQWFHACGYVNDKINNSNDSSKSNTKTFNTGPNHKGLPFLALDHDYFYDYSCATYTCKTIGIQLFSHYT